jgi:hypothetical protein
MQTRQTVCSGIGGTLFYKSKKLRGEVVISEVYMLSKHDDVRTFLNVLPVLLLYDASIMTIINTS